MKITFTTFLTTLLLWFCCADLPTRDVFADEPAAVTDNPQQPADQQSADERILRVVADLSSSDFAKRVQASRSLKTLNAGQLSQAIRTLDQQASAEAVVRLLAEIDDRYVSDNPEDVAAASQALEAFADQSRQLIADGAQLDPTLTGRDRAAASVRPIQARLRDRIMQMNQSRDVSWQTLGMVSLGVLVIILSMILLRDRL